MDEENRTSELQDHPTPIVEVKERLEDKVRLSVCVIGIGNAGNQIVAKANREGYAVFAINSSLKDLSDAVVTDTIPSFLAGSEARGAGKNREVAKALFKVNGKELFSTKTFTAMVERSDIVYVVGSTAGGTGSGIAPDLIYLLKQIYPKKIVIYYGIIPKLSDSIMSQYNTIDCMDEINGLKIPYMLADLAHFEDTSNDVAYEEIANHIIESINVVAGKYLNYSNSGMIDENDMRVIVSEPGYMSAYCLNRVTHQQVDKRSIQSYMIDLIKDSPAAPIIRDSIVRQLGVIVNCPEEMAEATKTGNYNELTSYIGTPFSIFENYSTNNASTGQFICLLSGMNLPHSRILQCSDIIKEAEEKLKRQKTIDLSAEKNEFEFIRGANSAEKLLSTEESGVQSENTSSLLSDFFK